jgi:hypothetical protein
MLIGSAWCREAAGDQYTVLVCLGKGRGKGDTAAGNLCACSVRLCKGSSDGNRAGWDAPWRAGTTPWGGD